MDDQHKLPFKKRKLVSFVESMDVEPSTSNDLSNVESSHIDRTSVSNEDFFDLRRKRARLSLNYDNNQFLELKTAFKGILKTYYLKNIFENEKDICLFLIINKDKVNALLTNLLVEFGSLKFNIVLECSYVKPLSNELEHRSFKTSNKAIFQTTDLNILLHNLIKRICLEETEYQGKGSGWTLSSVDGLLVRVSRYRPIGGSSYIPLTTIIADKHAVINPQNNDNFCFKWALLARYVKGKHVERVNDRYCLLSNKFNFDGITFPVSLKDVGKFEKNNHRVSINVYGIDKDNNIFPLKVCTDEFENHFDLLLLKNDSGISHYCYISHLSKLLRSQVTKNHSKMIFCKRCLSHFQGHNREDKLLKHKNNCNLNKPIRVKMPEVDGSGPPSLSFKNFHYKYKTPIVIYADFECILRKENRMFCKTVINNTHEPMSFCVYFVATSSVPLFISDKLPNEPYIYRGKDAASKFMDYLINISNIIGEELKNNMPMNPLTEAQLLVLRNATHCESCNDIFSTLNPLVLDHCHLTGEFRSVLCNACNLKRKNQKYLPVFIHGSSNYDSHFIVQQLGCDKRDITVVPNSNEKYVTFSKKTANGLTLRFVDTYRFLNASLSQLANNLPQQDFNITKRFFTQDDLPFVTRKGVYPYEYTSSWDRLDELELPSKEHFFNSITDCDINEEEYNFAKSIWNRFGCRTLGDYSDFYLRTDVLILSDVFENFRKLCIANYELDPAHYITLPSLTFDAMLKHTAINLELFSDYDKYMFIEQGIRGGITTCVKRNAKANNKYLDNLYDSSKRTSYLAYLDANNLYGYAMSKPMPKDGFKWLSGNLNSFDVMSIADDSSIGYILEVDVVYPSYLHDKHSDLPFLPENKYIEGTKEKKLLTTLQSKLNYVCHYINLKQAIRHGLIVKSVHKILQFNQSNWLKGYIDFNTEKRKIAKNDFEKDFYKLLNNAMFGKTIENIRKRKNLELVCNDKRLNRLISKPTFSNRIIYNENLCAVELEKESVYFNKPIYIGFSVLELSKVLMYKFHYDIMTPFYEKNIQLLYGDTDSFFYEIHTDDFYNDINKPQLKQYFDMSDYPKNHANFSETNKKVLGCFKDECCGIPLIEYIGLRPKLYTYHTVDDEYLSKVKHLSLRKAKGITKPVIKNKITFSDYKTCLFNDIKMRKDITIFRSKKHVVQTLTINKLALSANDNKRVVCSDGVNTLPYGHYLLYKNHDLS